MGTAAPGASVIVDAQCVVSRAFWSGATNCENTTIPNNAVAMNGALALTANAPHSTNTAGNAFWLREWQVVMLNGPTN
jgi:hypothetical protein